MALLYLTNQGCTLRKDRDRLCVEVQQGDAHGLLVLDLGHDGDEATVAAALGHQDLALDGHEVLAASQRRVAVDPARELARDTRGRQIGHRLINNHSTSLARP